VEEVQGQGDDLALELSAQDLPLKVKLAAQLLAKV